jgi:2-methylcitrate dehydratase PrpD
VLDERDAPWMAHATSFKPWPACRHAHPAIDAALALRARIAGRGIVAVQVESYADALAFCDRALPRSTVQAKFSLQHAVAVTLLDGPPPLSAFDPPALDRADLAALRACVAVAEGPGFTHAYPAHYGAAVQVTLADGTTLREAVPDALGDPENPLAEDAILAKARMLMEHAGVMRADGVIAAALALADGAPAAYLNDALP